MAVDPLPYGRQWLDDDDRAAVLDVLRGDWLTQGPAIKRFEEALCEVTGASHAVAVANGTAALHIATLAAGVRPGDLGATPDITFLASANCVRYAGGTPVLCDVEPDTGLLTAESLTAALAGRQPKVVIPVDFGGTPAPLEAIRAAAGPASVIEDAAHSLGATYQHNGREYAAASCAHTDMAILSFHPVKHVTTGEGGAVTTNDAGLATELSELRNHGMTRDRSRLERDEGPWWYEQRRLGFNYRISDIHCALGISQLGKLGRFVERRRELAARYDDLLATRLGGRVAPLRVPAWARSSYHLYVVRLPACGDQTRLRRRALFDALRGDGILVQVHYIPIHRQPDFVHAGFAHGEFPGAEALYEGCVSLPLFPAMRDEDVDRVVHSLERNLA
jgi:UDP-4-amino-4,6-dideoxy-N-acetyl-beta-L-altrosamine transaminase